MARLDSRIRSVVAREILDSRGNPTLEAEVRVGSGHVGRAAVPSGASTGVHEARELRDNDEHRYRGCGVKKAVANVEGPLARATIGLYALDQQAVDSAMLDLDRDKSELGANAMLAVSLAVARAAADASDLPLFRYLGGAKAVRLPVPMFNVLNGGVHAAWQGPDMQEFMIAPVGAPTFAEALRWGAEVHHTLKELLTRRGYPTGVGDEGGFAPPVGRNSDAVELVLQAVERAGYRPGEDIVLALDPAASAFFEGGRYHLRNEQRTVDAEELIELYADWVARYPLAVLEDGLAEDDWSGWKRLNARLGGKIELVGDDLFTTKVERIARGIAEKVANAVLVKPNQVGTLSETIAAVRLAYDAGWGAMASHRSGETVDTFIADLAVALDTGHLKAGAPCRGERVEKYNQLLRIEQALGERASFAGREAFVQGGQRVGSR